MALLVRENCDKGGSGRGRNPDLGSKVVELGGPPGLDMESASRGAVFVGLDR
jgi:hypothetical protein